MLSPNSPSTREWDEDSNLIVHIPLSQRRKCYDSMCAQKSDPELEQRWMELEAALDALQPFLVGLLTHPQRALVKPAHDCDRLVQDNG